MRLRGAEEMCALAAIPAASAAPEELRSTCVRPHASTGS
jgi:hypothetical protein